MNYHDYHYDNQYSFNDYSPTIVGRDRGKSRRAVGHLGTPCEISVPSHHIFICFVDIAGGAGRVRYPVDSAMPAVFFCLLCVMCPCRSQQLAEGAIAMGTFKVSVAIITHTHTCTYPPLLSPCT